MISVGPPVRRDPCLPSRDSRLWRLARLLLIALAVCLGAALAMMVAAGIGQVELLVLIALLFLLWPRILGRIRYQGTASGADQQGRPEDVRERQQTD
jgi:hypothetical protein